MGQVFAQERPGSEFTLLSWLIVRNLEEEVPPALGTVLVVTFWRFVCVPAFVLPIVYGFLKIPSYKVYLQDPAFVRTLRVACTLR